MSPDVFTLVFVYMSARIRVAPSFSVAFTSSVAVRVLSHFSIEADGDSWLVRGVGLDVVLKPSWEDNQATRGSLNKEGRWKDELE